MEDVKFFDSSVAAKMIMSRTKYPWVQVPTGKSFAVPKANISLKTLRSLASKTGKDLGKKFRVIDHEGDVYEVACLPMDEAQAIATSSSLVEALDKMEKDEE